MIKLIRQTSLPFKITFNFRTPRCFSQPTFSTSLSSQHLSISPPHFTPHAYAISLQSSIRNGDQLSGKSLHAHIIKSGNSLDVFGFNVLLNLYVKFDFLDDACKLFDEMTERNTVSFVTLLQGYSRCNMFYEGVGLFSRLHREGYELNAFVFSSVLKFVAGTELEELGYVVHGCVLKLGLDTDSFVGTALIDAYSIFGDVVGARQVFDEIGDKDMVSWTGMLACYAENGCFEESLSMFSLMRNNGFKPNNFTFAGVLKACVGLESFEVGKTVHGCVVKMCYERDTYVGTGLLELYTQLGDDGDIILLFEGMPKNDVVSWSFMIARYAQRDKSEEAVEMFCRMRQALVVPNQFTMTSMLQACAGMEGLELGMQIHCHVLKFGLDVNIFVSNALMDM